MTITAFTVEAEYVDEVIATREVKFIAALLKEMGYKGSDINYIRLYRNKQAVIKITINPINHPRTKYIDTDYH